jgi:class 3 adenylate cyclase
MAFVGGSETSATATFLFTDIEGSTQLLRWHRAEYGTILADHHRLLRGEFGAHGGREIDNQGDSFFVAFTRARDAVLAAVACQRALAAHSWPGEASVRVRMGIHTGEADLTVDRYVGLSVHRAARIAAVAHGGQVLVSQTTASLLEDEEDSLPGIALKDVGEHRLKDISRPVRLYQLESEGLRSSFPPLRGREPVPQRRWAIGAAVFVGLVLIGVAVAVVALTRDRAAPPKVLPDSLVRIDSHTLKPTSVVPIGDAADLVVAAGGFVWITHHVLRDTPSGELRNAGDRTLTRVDPATGDVVTVGGGLAPCGLAADPSGDLWVANCFPPGAGRANVVRVDATTLEFEATWSVPETAGFFRGLAYGGGSLWLSGIPRGDRAPTITQINPQTGVRRSILLVAAATPLAWSEGYGDLWMSIFERGMLARLHAATGALRSVRNVALAPAFLDVFGDTVWVGDWAAPRVVGVSAVGRPDPRGVSLPSRNPRAGVWSVAAGAESVWATTPRDHSLWKIDPTTYNVTRIAIPYLPTGVAVSDDAVWVTVR